MHNQDLLIEIGTEELPPKALLTLSGAFMTSFGNLLDQQELTYSAIVPYATPRRLALLVKSLASEQPDRTIVKFGPALQAAFSADGTPTRAAEGFARSVGVAVSDLEQQPDGKVVKLVYRARQQGEQTTALLAGLVNQALAALPIPKRMRWGSSRDEFVRPVQWVVLMYGEAVVDAIIMGQKTGNITRGHRFHHPDPISITQPDDYETLLAQGMVIADFSKRRSEIKQQIEAQAARLSARAIIADDLLDEVTALVEFPVALTGRFDESFLAVPKEGLISSLKEHQKCFHLLDANQNILPYFITVSNLQSKDPSQVIAGNEKVIRPRLADAAFFFNQDRKLPLASRIDKLKTVVFQQDLGTVYEKSVRVATLAASLATQLGYDAALARRAGELGKCDLVTSMVYEFAELQGIMGFHYATHDGEPPEVASALNEQYMPRFAGDSLPTTQTGIALALAERLDTIAGLFGLGQPPTGSKDPYALRRAALGILRIIIEKQLPLSLTKSIETAFAGFQGNSKVTNAASQMGDFIFDRLRAYYTDKEIPAEVFLAVDAVRPASPLEFDARMKAVHYFAGLPEAQALSAANKRVANILAKAEAPPAHNCDETLFKDSQEQSLFTVLNEVKAVVDPLLANKRFTESMAAMAGLRAPIDAFFEHVMVNADDPALRENRLALLHQLRTLFLRVADISFLQHV